MIKKHLFSLFTLTLAFSSLVNHPLNAELFTAKYPEGDDLPKELSEFNRPTVKVLIAHHQKGAFVEVKGRYLVSDPKTGEKKSMGLFGKSFTVHPLTDGIVWGEEFPDTYQVKVTPKGKNKHFWVDGVQYQGVLYIYQIGNHISLVNELEIEDYVKAVVASNTKTGMHEEAEAALAICARTEAAYKSKDKTEAFWHIHGAEVGYMGMMGSTKHTSAFKAGSATEGLCLKHADHRDTEGLFMTPWTGHSAGHTVASGVMDPTQARGSVPSVETNLAQDDRSNARWSYTLSKRDLEKKLELVGSEIKEVEVKRDPISQKVFAVAVTTNGETEIYSFFTFRQKLGHEILKSSDFSVRKQGDEFEIAGFGEGTGMGLCLYTADRMAQSGSDAPKILTQFFPDSQLEMVTDY